MFIKNNVDGNLVYRSNGREFTLTAHTVTYVDEAFVSAKELKDCYGDRIDVITSDIAETIINEAIEVPAQEVEEVVQEETTIQEVKSEADIELEAILAGEDEASLFMTDVINSEKERAILDSCTLEAAELVKIAKEAYEAHKEEKAAQEKLAQELAEKEAEEAKKEAEEKKAKKEETSKKKTEGKGTSKGKSTKK